ncbi:MAG TPA: HepT-like ribonuclease domain-containing protein [Vicinamibacteria bacterium]|nr:HepT-like ribonuclease domain-containing protein [Vicinamibacteria bacterium]
MLLFALVRAIEVVGESASKISEDLRREATTIPWGLIVSMRNRLIHGCRRR